MRAAALFALAAAGCSAGGAAVPTPTPHPVRVMSVNQCTDQLVLMLLPPDRIASVTWLARDPAGSVMAARARRVAANHGQAEEVLAQRPDLVVAGSFTTPALRAMLRRLGYPLIELEDAADIAGIRRITRQLAAALDVRPRGEALIAAMDARLAALAADPAPPIRVAAWDRAGFAAGKGSLYDAILTVAGARNVAREPATHRYRRPDVEALLAADPALLVQDRRGAPSLGDDLSRHRLVRQRWRGRTLAVPPAAYVCGTPLIADAALALRRDLARFR